MSNDAKQLRDLAKATLELLKDIEWVRDFDDDEVDEVTQHVTEHCPRCRGWKFGTSSNGRHEPDCGLKFLIDKCDQIIKAPWQVPVAGRGE